ncbi:MAG: ATP-binding protein, partial [Spirochaetia bacterium]
IKEDISKRILAERRLKLSNRFQAIGNQHIELDSLLQEYVAEIRQLSGCAAVGIRMANKHGRLRFRAALGYDSDFLERRDACPVLSPEHICAKVFRGDGLSGSFPSTPFGSYYADSLGTLTESGGICNLCINHGYASMAVIPIQGSDGVVGLIHVADQREGMLPLELVNTLESMAMQMAVAMQRVVAEETLRDSKKELQTIYDGMVDGVLIIDIETKELLVANQAACGMLGYSEKELLHMTMKELHPAAELEWIEDRFQDVLSGNLKVMKNLPCRRKDGGVFYADVGASAIRYDDRSCLVGFYRDITERKQTEEALHLMAAEMAHEIRNPLNAISTGIDLLVRGNGQIDKKLHEGLREESRRLEDILTNFLSYARPYVPKRSPVDINLVLEEIVSILGEDDRFADSTITTQLDGNTGKLPLDRDGIRQVLWNLALNGLQSMPDGGVLNLHSQYCNGCVQFQIKDTGCGMTPSQIEHIFVPFFTTKPQGTGLGLAIAQKIVKGHGGTIEVESTVGEGTLFQVQIPIKERTVK